MTFTMKVYADLLQTKYIDFIVLNLDKIVLNLHKIAQLQWPWDDPLRAAVLSFNYFNINKKEIFFSPRPNSSQA